MLEKTNLRHFQITLGDRGDPQAISNFEQFRDNQMFLDRLKDDLSRQRKFGCYRDWELNETKAALALLSRELKRPESHIVPSGEPHRSCSPDDPREPGHQDTNRKRADPEYCPIDPSSFRPPEKHQKNGITFSEHRQQ